MKPGLYQLYASLADGRLHSGAELASSLGITRAAIWKRIQALRALGLDVEGRAGDGYRLAAGARELLDAKRIRAELGKADIVVEVVGAVDSTNARLAEAGSPHATVLLAEAQTAGRGRRGRDWRSPLGQGLYLSLGWHFDRGLAELAPLSLVVGMAAADALEKSARIAVRVKWPNDLTVVDQASGEAKLGGCLVEVAGAADGPCRAIVGVGINLDSGQVLESVGQSATALARHADPMPGRNALAAALIESLATELSRFAAQGFSAQQRARWDYFDALRGRQVRVIRHRQPDQVGQASGIDAHGQLLLRCGTETITFGSGEVSVRVH